METDDDSIEEDMIIDEMRVGDLGDVDLGKPGPGQGEELKVNRVLLDDTGTEMRDIEAWREIGAFPPESTWQNEWYRLADLEKRMFGYPTCAQVMKWEWPHLPLIHKPLPLKDGHDAGKWSI
jgi:hypothetical protein